MNIEDSKEQKNIEFNAIELNPIEFNNNDKVLNETSTVKPNRVEQMKKIQAEALTLFTRKNIDYGDAFAKYGLIGVILRMEDKIQRSISITKNGVNLVSDEGIRDTLLDLHNYAAMALMLMDE
jgi:hypothetical protein